MPTLTAALSADRFATYLQWTSGDQSLAERLYTYNVQLSAALYGPLHMQEITLRNMADLALAQRFWVSWHVDPAVLTPGYPRDSVNKAIQSLKQGGKAGTRPQVIAELNFGFWSSLFGRQSHHLWQTLRPIFRHAVFSAAQSPKAFGSFASFGIASRITSRLSRFRLLNAMLTSRH